MGVERWHAAGTVSLSCFRVLGIKRFLWLQFLKIVANRRCSCMQGDSGISASSVGRSHADSENLIPRNTNEIDDHQKYRHCESGERGLHKVEGRTLQ